MTTEAFGTADIIRCRDRLSRICRRRARICGSPSLSFASSRNSCRVMRSIFRWRACTHTRSSTAIAAKATSAAMASRSAAADASRSMAPAGACSAACNDAGSPSANHNAPPTRPTFSRLRMNSASPSAPNIRFRPLMGSILASFGASDLAETSPCVCTSVAATAPTVTAPATGRIKSAPSQPSTSAASTISSACARSSTARSARNRSRPSEGNARKAASNPPSSAAKPATSRDSATWPSSRARSMRLGVAASERSSGSGGSSPSAMDHRAPGSAAKLARSASA